METLYFLACLASSPATCDHLRLTLPEHVDTPQQCLMAAQPSLAAWTLEHPEYRVAKWRCGRPIKDDGRDI